jgi:hypothetical protein
LRWWHSPPTSIACCFVAQVGGAKCAAGPEAFRSVIYEGAQQNPQVPSFADANADDLSYKTRESEPLLADAIGEEGYR